MPSPFPKKSNSAKVAITTVVYLAYAVECPHCFVEQGEPHTGSLNWFDNENHGQHSQVCYACNKAYKLPKVLRGK